jgi:hypothetical protein
MATPLKPLSSPPLQQIIVDGVISTQWSSWFDQLWRYAKGPFVSSQSGSQDLAMNILFFPDEVSLVSYLLPVSASVGDIVTVIGKGSGGWQVTQNAGQIIHTSSGSTTPGTGTLSSTNRYDVVVLVCIADNVEFSVLSSTGTLSIT